MDATPEAAEREWAEGRFRPVYLFVGEDAAGKGQAVEALRKALKVDDFNFSDYAGELESQAGEIVAAASTPPMFSERRFVLSREVKLGLGGRKALVEYLKDPLPSTVLVLLSGERKADAKDSVVAAASRSGLVVFFGPLRPEQACARLREEAKRLGFALSEAAAALVVDEVGSEWGILRGELEKIRLFLGERKEASEEAILACLGYRPETGPFDFANALDDGDPVAALRILRRKFEEGEEAFGPLRQLTTAVNKQLKAKRMMKAGISRFDMFGQLRVFGPSRQDRFIQAVNKAGEARLLASLRACHETEAALKSKAWLDPACELERLVVWIYR
ncbi:MAG: DNA polymerase III subunit delta [Elusimicrobiota bacterium]|jgi:DNA polymerase-3 subunit delta